MMQPEFDDPDVLLVCDYCGEESPPYIVTHAGAHKWMRQHLSDYHQDAMEKQP